MDDRGGRPPGDALAVSSRASVRDRARRSRARRSITVQISCPLPPPLRRSQPPAAIASLKPARPPPSRSACLAAGLALTRLPGVKIFEAATTTAAASLSRCGLYPALSQRRLHARPAHSSLLPGFDMLVSSVWQPDLKTRQYRISSTDALVDTNHTGRTCRSTIQRHA